MNIFNDFKTAHDRLHPPITPFAGETLSADDKAPLRIDWDWTATACAVMVAIAFALLMSL